MKLLSTAFVIFFIYVIICNAYIGISTAPTEGDSLAYHIPIAKEIIAGQVLHPHHILDYYPSIGESILAILIVAKIPLNVFNVVALVGLFWGIKTFGEEVGLKKPTALIAATSICTLQVMIRWLATQTIDIWLAVFFVWSTVLLLKPQRSLWYFTRFGIFMGLLIGTKISGPIFAVILLIVYGKKLFRNLTTLRFFGFIIPFILFGVSWYIRNLVLTGNPFYPQTVFVLKGDPSWNLLKWHVGNILVAHPIQMANALFGDYLIWSAVIFLPLIVWILNTYKHIKIPAFTLPLLLVGLLNLAAYLFLPSTMTYSMMVSSLRYSYPAFIPLIICVFIFAQALNKEELLSLLAFSSMLTLFTTPYRPKLLLFLLAAIGIHHVIKNRNLIKNTLLEIKEKN